MKILNLNRKKLEQIREEQIKRYNEFIQPMIGFYSSAGSFTNPSVRVNIKTLSLYIQSN